MYTTKFETFLFDQIFKKQDMFYEKQFDEKQFVSLMKSIQSKLRK